MNSSGINLGVIATVNSVSVIVCLLAAVLVLRLKLHKKLVYRLALYQVLSSLLLATVTALQVIFINYNESLHIYAQVCTAVAWIKMYVSWVKLFFVIWVAFHLFCFGVLQKNLKKLEVLYVVTSLLVPALIAIVPLVTHTYGLSSDGAFCYIYANESVAFIERLALWDGPATIMLIATSMVMVVMVIKLACLVYQRSEYEPITDGDQYWKALKQLLPLAAFPILFFIFEIPVFLYHVYTTQYSTPNEGMLIADGVCLSLWSTASGATLIIHISVAHIRGRKNKSTRLAHVVDSHTLFTQHVGTGLSENSATRFSLPSGSV